jgi:hypothetical protein
LSDRLKNDVKTAKEVIKGRIENLKNWLTSIETKLFKELDQIQNNFEEYFYDISKISHESFLCPVYSFRNTVETTIEKNVITIDSI